MFSVCHVILQDHVSSRFGVTLWVSQQHAKFCGHRCCGGRNIIILGCQVISLEHVIKGSCNYMVRSQTRKITSHVAKFGGHRHCGEDIIFFSRDLTKSGDQRVIWLYRQEFIEAITILSSLVTIGTVVVLILVSHLISEGYVAKGLCDVIGRVSLSR